MQELGIESSVLRDILNGRKTIEGRLGKQKFLSIHEGDTLTLREDVWSEDAIIDSIHDVATIEITQVLYFESFTEMLSALDFAQVIPAAKTEAEALAVYRKFYSEEDEKEYGVVAFEFELT